MPRNPTRRSISISVEHYDMLKAHIDRTRFSMSSTVEVALEKFIGNSPKRDRPLSLRKGSAHYGRLPLV